MNWRKSYFLWFIPDDNDIRNGQAHGMAYPLHFSEKQNIFNVTLLMIILPIFSKYLACFYYWLATKIRNFHIKTSQHHTTFTPSIHKTISPCMPDVIRDNNESFNAIYNYYFGVVMWGKLISWGNCYATFIDCCVDDDRQWVNRYKHLIITLAAVTCYIAKTPDDFPTLLTWLLLQFVTFTNNWS